MTIRILKNVTSGVLVLEDFHGLRVAAGEAFDGLAFGAETLRESASIQACLLAKQLELHDGYATYTDSRALAILNGYATQYTRDGKPITTVSDRPKDFYRCFSGRGDNIGAGVIGGGAPLQFSVAPGDTQHIVVRFVDDVYIRDGEIKYEGASIGSTLTVDVVCPANTPFPSPTNTGNLDFVDGTFVPNTTNSGSDMTVGFDVVLLRLINGMHLLGSGQSAISSPEPVLLSSAYFMRYSVYAASGSQVLAVINIGMYRKQTV